MKKILLILLIGLVTSCVYHKVDGETETPQNVISATNIEQADSLIFIGDDNYHYYFNNVNGSWVLKEKYNIRNDYVTFGFVWIIIIFFGGFIIGGLIFFKQ